MNIETSLTPTHQAATHECSFMLHRHHHCPVRYRMRCGDYRAECALGRWGAHAFPSPSGAGLRCVRCRSLLRGVKVSYVGLPKPLRRMPVAPAVRGVSVASWSAGAPSPSLDLCARWAGLVYHAARTSRPFRARLGSIMVFLLSLAR